MQLLIVGHQVSPHDFFFFCQNFAIFSNKFVNFSQCKSAVFFAKIFKMKKKSTNEYFVTIFPFFSHFSEEIRKTFSTSGLHFQLVGNSITSTYTVQIGFKTLLPFNAKSLLGCQPMMQPLKLFFKITGANSTNFANF